MQKLKFHTLSGQQISGTIKDIERLRDLQGKDVFKSNLNFSFEDFQQIKANAWFNNYPEINNGAQIGEFSADRLIEVQLILRSDLMDLLGEKTAQEVFTLMQTEDKEFAFLNQSESWKTYKVLQQKAIPQNIDGTIALPIAYDTYFAVSPKKTKTTTQPKKASSLMEVVKSFLASRNQNYDLLKEDIIKIVIKSNGYAWPTLINVREDQKHCLIYSILPVLVPEQRRVDVGQLLLQINSELGLGAFEMNIHSGETRFRTSVNVTNSYLSRELFENTFSMNLKTMNVYIKGLLAKINEGK